MPKQVLDHDELTVHIDARPSDVYALLADVTRMPEFSPEVLECVWADPAAGPVVGARFTATNKLPGRPPWKNHPMVTKADPAREFEISRTEKFAGTVVWNYRLEPDRDGTLLTESYTVTEPITRFGWFIIGTLFGGKDRRTALRTGMVETLRRLAEVAEQSRRTSGHC